jgi:uncharacterized protein
MIFRSQYVIPLKGIKDGIHFFDLVVEDRFFESFDKEEIFGGKVEFKIEVKKSSLLTTIGFSLTGYVIVPCDRCLENFELSFSSKYEMFVKFSDSPLEDDDNVIYLKPEQHELDLFPYVLELIQLSLPLKKVHPDKENGKTGCNNEMLKKLKKYLVKEKPSGENPWDELKKLLSN